MDSKQKKIVAAAAATVAAGAAGYYCYKKYYSKENRILLPTNVTPTHYDILLQPDLEAFTFSGKSCTRLSVNKTTSSITLHANELEIQKASVTTRDGDVLVATKVKMDKRDEAQTATIVLPKSLAANTEVTLILEFTGILNDKMAGFYRSSYTTAQGQTKYMAVTQFEATDARRAFPCWDEPALKARFDVTLRTPVNRVALSNMPPTKETPTPGLDGWKDVRFETTPIMSTYLVAFCVGEFDVVESKTAEGVAVRVWTPPGLKEQGRFALDVACKTLSFFTKYFDQPYPLPKMDMVAVPDFAAGAMENWGLVTYRTVLVLYDQNSTAASVKQQIAYVVCHELAHQWFGNLVTMEWWEHLWLNEGFATWVGWLAVDNVFPQWRVWEQFLVNEQARGLELDGLRSSHPIEVEIPDSSKVNEIFDAISYAKGASAIHMLVAYLGETAFKEGMRLYVHRHKWGNASTGHLWAALEEASGKPVKSMMACWTKQTGYPVVKVKLESDARTLGVSQERFLSTGPDAKDATQWLVPLRCVTSAAPSGGAPGTPEWDALVSDRSAAVQLSQPAAWVKVNYGQAGFFRVCYSPKLLSVLGPLVPKLPASDRAGLVGDAFALAAAGYQPTVVALSLLVHYKEERDYVVWANIAAGLSGLMSVWFASPDDVTEGMERFAVSLYGPLVAHLGWEPKSGESHLSSLLRTLANGRAAHLGDPGALKEARARFASFCGGDEKALSPDLRGGVFKAVLAHGGAAEFDRLVGIYEGAKAQELRIAVLAALGASKDPALIRRALEYNLSDKVRKQDLMYIVASAAGNPKGRVLAWEFFQERFGQIQAMLDGSGFLLGRLLTMSTASLTSEEDARAVEAFFSVRNVPALQRTVRQSVEKIRGNAGWLERDGAAVAAWIRELPKK